MRDAGSDKQQQEQQTAADKKVQDDKHVIVTGSSTRCNHGEWSFRNWQQRACETLGLRFVKKAPPVLGGAQVRPTNWSMSGAMVTVCFVRPLY